MSDAVLTVVNLHARYGAVSVLHGINLEVRRGQLVALLGANGAGKTTALRAISGLLPPHAGTVRLLDQDITRHPAHKLPHIGLVHVPEGRHIFGSMSVQENLELGSFILTDNAQRERRLSEVFETFPILAARRRQDASFLSGGEQQMLAIGRALMAQPKLLLLDEPSMGLAPLMVKEVMKIVERLHANGTTILLVEQNSKVALKFADYGYVLDAGRVALEGRASELLHDDAVVKTYLGGGVSL
jgi:branched-chain amino acid transport system ATP-binding protein